MSADFQIEAQLLLHIWQLLLPIADLLAKIMITTLCMDAIGEVLYLLQLLWVYCCKLVLADLLGKILITPPYMAAAFPGSFYLLELLLVTAGCQLW